MTFAIPEATFKSDKEYVTMQADAGPRQTGKKCKRSELTFAIPKTTSKSTNEDNAMEVDAGPRQTGVVTRWDNGRGFGFIEPHDGGKDVFCHVTVIQDGNSLEEGSTVSYSAVYDDQRRKYRAENVTGGVTIDRIRPSEVVQALKDETRFTRYSLGDIDMSNSSNTKVGGVHSHDDRVLGRRFVLCVVSIPSHGSH